MGLCTASLIGFTSLHIPFYFVSFDREWHFPIDTYPNIESAGPFEMSRNSKHPRLRRLCFDFKSSVRHHLQLCYCFAV